MKILIEIPNTLYERYKELGATGQILTVTENAICNGTPLPKGHGRLIDADAVVDGFEDNYELCIAVNSTPTIIEADKEGEEE